MFCSDRERSSGDRWVGDANPNEKEHKSVDEKDNNSVVESKRDVCECACACALTLSWCVHCSRPIESHVYPSHVGEYNSNVDSNFISQKNSPNHKSINQKTSENRRKRVAVLNVGGLHSKLKFPEFHDFIESKDIICLTETKLDEFDHIDINNFTCFKKNRLHCKRKSGGIAALIRNTLCKHIKIIENIKHAEKIDFSVKYHYKFVTHPVSKDCLILEMPPNFITGCRNLYLCVAYIPPENSPYANMNFFQDLEETLLNLGAESVILAGDLNARTAGLRDFIESCDILDDMVDYESTTDLMKR